MPVRWYAIVVDCRDPRILGGWWADVLGYKCIYEAPDEYVIVSQDEREPGIVFVPVPEGKATKNRLHIDLAPDDRDAEVERLVGMGASHVEIGQSGDETWVVLADPEGNEFCVLSAR